MKINSVGTVNNINNKAENKNAQSNPNFKGLLDAPGVAMNFIEKGGFAASFLIQDTAGMTAPRTGEGLIRGIDKDRVDATFRVLKAKLTFQKPSEEDKKKCLHFKDLNFKEGTEVAIREGLSGPFMMFTPMLVLALGKKFVGKSTFTNSSMIKRLGNKLKETVKSANFDNVKDLKEDFYRKSITDIVKSTTNTKNEAVESAFIEKATKGLMNLDEQAEYIAKSSGRRKSKAKKVLEKTQKELIQEFNNFHKENSADLDMVNKVKFDGEVYSTEKTINGLRGYAEDALKGIKNPSEVTEQYAQNTKNNAMIKRGIVNASAIASTIGSLSLVPMLYKLVNPVPPGALGDPVNADAVTAKAQAPVDSQTKPNNNGQVSFTGKWDKVAKTLEFNGNQFTPALMTSLAVGGLMTPRVLTAAKRAPEDPITHKKDYSEIPEALTRDITSTAAVTFGVPMASKALISSYEHASGFVLKNRPDKPMSTAKKVLDMLNPFSAFGYYGINDLDQIYGNIDNTEKLTNMSKFIDKNGGSVAKVLDTEKKVNNVFSEFGLDLKSLAKQNDRTAANKTILDKLNECSEFGEKLVEAIKPAKGKDNKILKRARSLNSFVSCAATFLIVPAFLGMVLPKMVYKMTEKRQAKAAAAKEAYLAQQKEQQQPEAKEVASNKIDYSKLKNINSSQTFQQLRHS
ncbi:hypothetical protein J6O48_00885 [bacterium]|nr:hypothetical protein [bacterium]